MGLNYQNSTQSQLCANMQDLTALFVLIILLPMGARSSQFLLLFRVPALCPFVQFCSPWNPDATDDQSKKKTLANSRPSGRGLLGVNFLIRTYLYNRANTYMWGSNFVSEGIENIEVIFRRSI